MKTRPRRTLVINSFSSCPRCGRQGGGCACRPVLNPLNPFVVNHRDPELLLDEPAYNWGAIVEEQRTGRPPRQRPAPTAHYVGDCLPDAPGVFAFNEKAEDGNADAVGGGSVQMGDAEDDDYDNEPEPTTRRRAGGEKERDDFDFDDDLGAPGEASVMLDRARSVSGRPVNINLTINHSDPELLLEEPTLDYAEISRAQRRTRR